MAGSWTLKLLLQIYGTIVSTIYIQMPNPWILRLALHFALYAIAISIYIMVSPFPAFHLFLFGQEPYPLAGVIQTPLVPIIALFGGRNFAVGLAMLAFHWQRRYRAMGTVLICCTLSGLVDTVVMSLWGMKGTALVLGLGCVVFGLTGLGLLGEQKRKHREETLA